ncbi:hypothetical protein EPN29_04665 [bacterium]|nr:MAG: hypothetical protein EPN29_04665 [bacterium]
MDHILPYLFFLACPISMGVMMWLMMPRHHKQGSAPTSDPRVAELESQLGEVRMALHQRQGVATATPAPPTPNAERE